MYEKILFVLILSQIEKINDELKDIMLSLIYSDFKFRKR